MDAMTVAPNSFIAFEDPANDPSSRVVAVQLLINLEEEPVATDTEEKPKAAINPIAI